MGLRDEYMKWRNGQGEQEEEEKKEEKGDRVRESLSLREKYEYDKLNGYSPNPVPKDEEVAALTEPGKLLGKLADRGITIQLPEPEKEPVIDERPTLADAFGTGRSTTSFTDRLRNTAGARKTEQDALAALEEETHRNETVRNQEWLDSLRSEEEIQKDLDAAKKETGAAKRKDFWEGLKGDLKYLFGGVNEDERGQEDFNRYQKENAEKIQTLKDELSERKWADYEQLRNNKDFEENSQYQPTKNWEKAKKDAMGRYTSTGYDDLEYEYVNGTAGVGDILESKKQEAGVGQGLSGQLLTPKEYEYEQWSEMTDDERSLYNYIYKTQSPEDAHEYLEFLRSDLYARQAEREKARAAAQAEAHPIESTLATVGLSLLKGLAYAGQARDYLSTGEIDENAPYNRIAYLPAAEREAVTKQIEQNWGELGTWAYGTGVSMLEFVLNSFVTGTRFLNPETDLGKMAEWASLMVMGTGAAADATISAKERGLDDDQAFWLGTVAGTAEVITEKVSIEALFSNPWEKSNLAKWLQDVIYFGQNFGAEFSEETASDAINWTADVLIAQDKSEWRQAINRYMTEDHMSEQDAFLAALKDKGWDLLKSGLGGGFSGGFMAGSNVAYRNIAQGAQESYDRSQDIEAARSATQAVRNLGQEKPNVMAGIEQAQQQTAQSEGIVLPTAEEAARTEGNDSGDTLRFGTEPETKTLTPTVEEAETNAAVEKAEAEGNITRATGIRYGVKEKLIRTMERLGEITGHRVHFFAGALKNGKVVNGYTDKATGDIYINTKAKQPALFTFAHEFTHNLEGTDAYKALMDHIKTRAAETGTDWLAKRADMRQLYERGTGQQVDDAYVDEEILADWIGDNLSDEKTIREICRENPSAAKRIHDALDSFIIRAANAGGIMTDYEARKYKNVVGMIERYIGEAGRDLEQTASENAQEVQENAQITPENAQEVPENAGTAPEAVYAEPETTEWKNWENAERELSAKWKGVGKGEFTSALEELYSAAEKTAGTTEDGKIDLSKLDFRTMEEPVMKLAADIADSAVVSEENPEFAELREAREYLRKTPIYYDPDAVKAEFGDAESYNRWRKRLFGSLRMTTDRSKGVPADVIFDEFSEQYPGHVDMTALSDVERLTELAKAADDMRAAGGKKIEVNPYQQERDSAVIDIAVDLMNELQNRLTGQEPVREWQRQQAPAKRKTRNAKPKTVQSAQTANIMSETPDAEVNANETPGQYLMRMQDLYADGQISEEDLAAAEDLAAEMESTGRGIASSTVERDEGPRGKIAEAVDRIAGRRYSLTEADDSQRKENAKKAVDFFGRTYSWNETGYITQNGDRIDFSGRHEGMRGGRRTVDHRDIIDALGDDYGGDNYSDGMVRFMGEGNIRISPESGGINIGPVEPTVQQYLRLTDFIQKNRGEVIVDLDDAQGRTISSVEYPSGTRSSKVLDSIRDYFRDGTLPEEPEIRYSLAEDPEKADADYMAAVEAGDEAAQRMVDEAAERAGYTRRMWHGAKSGKTFTKFRGWSYFTEDRAFAEKYTNRDPENLYGVYAKVEHPFDTRTDRKARRIFEEARRENGFTQLGDSGLPDWTDGYDLADYIDENELDYDGILLDEGEQYVPNARGELEPRGRVVSYVIRDSAQIKSADPVTYDDDGEPIKLSERFNDQDPDIRWSLSEDKAKQNDIRYSIDAGWENAVDKWDKAGRPSTETFTVGRTSDSLRSIGVEDRSITWTGKKIKKIFKKHPAMTLDVVKQVPNVIENPILVLKSRTVDGRITAFGEVYDTKGIPVLAALDLQPESGGCEIEDVITINSAYGKDHDLRDFILNSDVLYVDPDVKRTDSWLKSVRLQLPSAQTNIGPIGSITYPDGKVNISGEKAENIFETENTTEEDAEQIDRDYAGAVESGDIETAQRLVDEAARDAGYTIKVYHGTPQETISAARGKVTGEDYQNLQTDYADKLFPFVVFKGDGRLTGIYTATDRGVADTFSFNFSDTGTVYDLYAKADNPLRFDALGSGWNSIPGNLLSEYGMGMPGRISLDDVARYAKENGYDAVIADNVRETGSGDEGSPVTTDVIVFDPSQVKSADPEVYDDAGELIPLSERFNDQSDDIRYSMSEEEKRIGESPADDTDSYYFKRWFGDWQNDPENASKVVNPDGTPKRMYHGTNADREFTMFNTYGANYGLYGAGSYFTDNPEVAQGYTNKGRGKNPRVYQVYLNIRNPIVMEQEADVDRWLNALPELVDYITVPGDSELAAVTNRDFYRAMEEYFADQGLTKWEAAEDAMDTLKAMGYDGINHVGGMNKDIQHDVWIAFDPEQIKSATENIGTYDTEEADIRYSMEEDEPESLEEMTRKAQNEIRSKEREFAMNILQAAQIEMNPRSEQFKELREEVIRPALEAMLRGEEVSPDELLEKAGVDIIGQAAARGATIDAIRRARTSMDRIRTGVIDRNAREEIRAQRNAELEAALPQDDDGYIKLGEKVKDVQQRFSQLKARMTIGNEDTELVHKIATGQMSLEEAQAKYQTRIEDLIPLIEAEKEYLETNELWDYYKKKLEAARRQENEKLLENVDKAKDKATGLAYATETAERNIRDVFGDKAEAIIDHLFRPVHVSEAESTRFKNRYIDRVKKLELSQKVKRGNQNSEAAAVQFLGEAEDNVRVLETARRFNAVRDGKTLSEWKAEIEAFKTANPNLDYEKVRRGIEEFQQIYKELIEEMNKVLVRNGYLPVNVRRGYFPHFQSGNDTVMATFAHALGINLQNNALPTSINGLTSMFKPGKPWFGHAMERTGIKTDYDAVAGFEGYIGGVSDVIHQTDNIRNLRSFFSQIRETMGNDELKKRLKAISEDKTLTENEKQAAIDEANKRFPYLLSKFVAWGDEYTNLLANKKSKYDRVMEDLFGRVVYNVVKNLESRVAANMIAGNAGSALTNFIPLNQAASILGERNLARGMYATLTRKIRGDDLAERSNFLTNRRGTDKLTMRWTDKVSDKLKLNRLMDIIDGLTSEAVVRTAYERYIRDGMDDETALQMADETAAGIMADRSKGALPTIFASHNPIFKAFTQFQVEVNNEFRTVFKDIPKGVYLPDKEKKRLSEMAGTILIRYFLGAMLFNDLYEKVVGRRAALDPLNLLNDLIGDLTGKKLNNAWDAITGKGILDTVWEDEEDRPNTYKVTENFATGLGEELPFVGGVLFGGGRIPAGSAIPKLEKLNQAAFDSDWDKEKKAEAAWREIGGTAGTYLLPPMAGGLIKKGVQTATNMLSGGRTVKNKEGEDQMQYPFYTEASDEDAARINQLLGYVGLDEYTPQVSDVWGTGKELLSSAAFGPTSTEGGREWVEGGFGNQTAKKTALYRTLTKDMGENQREAWDVISSLNGNDTQKTRMTIATSRLSDEGKAAAMETMMNSGSSTEGTKFRAAYDNGVSADAWAWFFDALDKYNTGSTNVTQDEAREALENTRIPLSNSEGSAQSLFGGSYDERELTNREKAVIWSAYRPDWKAKNNPYDPNLGETVSNQYYRMKDGNEE